MSAQTPRDHFPTTLMTYIRRELRGGSDTADLRRYLMEVYAEPLLIFLQGWRSPLVRSGDELRDIVHGFFVSRLSKPDFMMKWSQSGRPLRAWLMTSIKYYIKELRAVRKDAGGEVDPDEFADENERDAAAAMNRALIPRLVRRAMDQARATAADAGCSEHWNLFELKTIQALDAASLVNLLSAPERRAVVDECPKPVNPGILERRLRARVRIMARTGHRHFVKQFRDVLENETNKPGQVDELIVQFFKILKDMGERS